jgi:aminodeoxyfutalosine deaminase
LIESGHRARGLAELHLHLQGAIRPATLRELAARHGISLPLNEGGTFAFRDFAHFVEVYALLRSCLVEAADFELAAYELGENLSEQDVRYAEVTCTPGPEIFLKAREHFFDGLSRGRQRARSDFGVEINWIFDIPRRTVTLHPDLPLADFITDVAVDGRHEGVVALGLAGTEAGYPPEPFEPWFDRARAAGLHSTVHAGETAGPASVWGALRALGAERIGHGVRAVEDPALLAYLVQHRVPLEVCPTSNVRLGVFGSYAEVPVKALHDAGAMLTINTDTPAVFGITLNQEVGLLTSTFGLSQPAADGIVQNAWRARFGR